MDARIAAATSHWAPRFTANGVPVADFERVTGGLESWEDWCGAWSRAASVHEELGTEALGQGRWRSAGAHLHTAAVLYHFAKFVFVVDPDQMRTAHANAVRCDRAALPFLDPPAERVEIPFEGSTLVGNLRLPTRGPGPFPAVVCLPGLDSAKEELQPTEDLFLARGMATFSVDGPGQGEAEYDLPIRPDWEVPATAIVDVLVARPEIDAARIGVWGVSLGGYYSARFASGDGRVAACISLCGPYNFGDGWDRLPGLTRETFVVRSRSADDEEGRAKALTLSMEGRTDLVTCPTLVIAGRLDRIIPWQEAQRLHREIEGSDFLLLEDGNHGGANVLAKHRYRAADWMGQRLGAFDPAPRRS